MSDTDSSSARLSLVRLVLLVLGLVVLSLGLLFFVFSDYKHELLNQVGQSQLGQSPVVKKLLHLPEVYPVQFQIISHLPQYQLDQDSLNYPLLTEYLQELDLLPLQDRPFFSVDANGQAGMQNISPQLVVVNFYPAYQVAVDRATDASMRMRSLYRLSTSEQILYEYYRGQLSADGQKLTISVYLGEMIFADHDQAAVERLFTEQALQAIFFSIQPRPLSNPTALKQLFRTRLGVSLPAFIELQSTSSLLEQWQQQLSQWRLVTPVSAAAGCLGGAECGRWVDKVDPTIKVCIGGVYDGTTCDPFNNDCGAGIECTNPTIGQECVYDYFTNCNYFGTGNCGEICGACVVSSSCTYDSGLYCGDGICSSSIGENTTTCPSDCGSSGGPYCGDGNCNNGETCDSCASDCGSCTACGDGSCNNGETCSSCAADCGVCPVVTADVKANGSDVDITVGSDYTISWTSTNADSCTLNSSAVALNGSQLESATTNGAYPYNFACTSATWVDDADSVNVTVELCGNGTCSAFENCALCAEDCGACPTAWWQVAGGNLFSALSSGNAIISDIPSDATCVEPSCVPGLSIRDRAGTVDSDGFPVTGGGAIDNNGQMVTYRNPDVYAIGTIQTRLYENYSYFYRKYSLGLSPADDYTGSDEDALKPATTKDAYFHSGDMTIQSPWDVASGESYVIFVDGDLNIEDPLAEGELIKVAEGGFLAFIVSGDINIDESVGHSTLSNTAGNIEGVFVADGIIHINSNGTADKKFIGEGSFVGWTGVSLSRTYDETGSNNDLYPAETFVYRPDFVKNAPTKMKRAQMLWQETN